jgi:LysM repeat protein
MTKQSTSMMPIVRRLAFVLLVTMLMGCGSLQRPQLAERPRNASENQWAEVVQRWYPEWNSPIHPEAIRDNKTTIITVPAPGPQPIELHTTTPAPVATPTVQHPPQERLTPGGPPVDEIPGRLPQLIRDPNEAPAARQTFHLVPVEGSGGSAATARIYRVRKGDTLNGIARKFYGTSTASQAIFDANRDVLSNLNHVRSGMMLKLP